MSVRFHGIDTGYISFHANGAFHLAFYWSNRLLCFETGDEAAKKPDSVSSTLGRENVSLILSKFIPTDQYIYTRGECVVILAIWKISEASVAIKGGAKTPGFVLSRHSQMLAQGNMDVSVLALAALGPSALTELTPCLAGNHPEPSSYPSSRNHRLNPGSAFTSGLPSN